MKAHLILPLLAIAAFSANAETVTPVFPCTEVLENPYGICAHLTKDYCYKDLDTHIRKIKEAGIGCVRFDFNDWMVMKKHGRIDTECWDTVLARCKENKLLVLPIISRIYKGDIAWKNRDGYLKFVDMIMDRYKGEVKYWEVMNEVDIYSDSTYVDGKGKKRKYMDYEKNAAGYSSILPDVYDKIKASDKSAEVLFTGIATIKNSFFKHCCDNRIEPYFDIMNYHTYREVSEYQGLFKSIREQMDLHGWQKPMWITECGMSTVGGGKLETEQAEKLPKAFLTAFAYGVNRVFWYSILTREQDPKDKEHYFGILHADFTPKPAYLAYKTLTRFCPDGSTRPVLNVGDGINEVTWTTPKGKKVRAVWSDAGAKPRTMKFKGKAKVYSCTGEIIKGSVNLTASPVYIMGAKSVEFL